MLFHNEIVPGQKISYRDLSERLGMSQTPVIQALKWLEFQQLVCHEPNRGYYTASIDLQEVEEIYDFRELIETDLLKTTIDTIDPTGTKRLASALEAHRKAAEDENLYDRLSTDMALHLTLAELSGRRVHVMTLKNLFDLLYLKYGARFLFSSSIDAADIDHKNLFDHIKKGNYNGAIDILSGHIKRVKRHVLNAVGRVMDKTRSYD